MTSVHLVNLETLTNRTSGPPAHLAPGTSAQPIRRQRSRRGREDALVLCEVQEGGGVG